MFFVCLFFVFVFCLNIHNYNLQTQWLGATVQRPQALLNREGAAGRGPSSGWGPQAIAYLCLNGKTASARTSSQTLQSFKRFDDSFQAKTHCVELANGTRCMGVAERRGDTEVGLIDSKGRHLSATLRQALYIPSFSQDILSVTAATASGATVIFKKGKNALIHKDGTKFHIHVHDRLYYVLTLNEDKGDDQCKGCHDMQTWHEILGH